MFVALISCASFLIRAIVFFFGIVSDAYFEGIRQEKIVPVLELVPAGQFNFGQGWN